MDTTKAYEKGVSHGKTLGKVAGLAAPLVIVAVGYAAKKTRGSTKTES